MDLTLTAAVDLLRKWEQAQTAIYGSLFSNSQELQMTFAARVGVERETIKLTPASSDFDMRLTLKPTMVFIESSNGAVLEIRATAWRCVLSESQD